MELEIFEDFLDDVEFHDFELRLYKSYRTREYCVQYRETNFNFVSRLMEEEGICYFSSNTTRTPRNTRSSSPIAPAPPQNLVPASPKHTAISPPAAGAGETISEWRPSKSRPSAWAQHQLQFRNAQLQPHGHGKGRGQVRDL